MIKKLLFQGSLIASFLLLGLSLGLAQPAHAQIVIDPATPNCFGVNELNDTGYAKQDCSLSVLGIIQYGKPLEAGKCYLDNTVQLAISFSEIDCAKLTENAEEAEEAREEAASQVDQNREEVANCTEGTQKCFAKNPLIARFNQLINFLSIGVSVIVTIMIIIGGIQYTTSSSNPQAVAAAKKRIFSALIALVAYFLVYAFMQYLLPGGPF